MLGSRMTCWQSRVHSMAVVRLQNRNFRGEPVLMCCARSECRTSARAIDRLASSRFDSTPRYSERFELDPPQPLTPRLLPPNHPFAFRPVSPGVEAGRRPLRPALR